MERRDGAGGSRASVPEEPPYEGEAGRTRLEHVHVTIPGGYVRTIRVYTAVNVGSDPELREAALSGALHRFEGGEELAIPFVYHDPVARRFALVVPEALRHRELVERVRLLESLAADTQHPIPPYVREAHATVGLGELRDYLGQPGRSAELAGREAALEDRSSQIAALESALGGRDEQLAQREQRLMARAEDVTRREDDLRLGAEEIEAQQRDLAVREAELERRVEGLEAREAELRRMEAELRLRESSAGSVRPSRPASAPPAASEPARAAPIPSDVQEVDDEVDDVEELDDLEAVRTTAGAVVTSSIVEVVTPAAALEEIADEAVEELVDEDEDVEELDDLEAIREVTGVTSVAGAEARAGAAEAPGVRTDAASRALEGARTPPPEGFLQDRDAEMAATVADGGVHLFAKLEEGKRAAFREGGDLLVQLVVVQGYPVVVLALAESAAGRPYVRRMAIDPRDRERVGVLEALRNRFEATVALFGPGGTFERTVEVAAPRRVNVAMVLERVGRMSAEAQIDGPIAVERALAAPPPVREAAHPFQSDDPQPAEGALDASQRLARLFEWSTPEKLDRALLALSVPRDVVDDTMRRVLADAVDHGIALPAPLLSRAVSVGVAPEPGELVTRQIAAFQATLERPDRGGLTLEDVADNWEQLLAAASDNEVSVDPGVHDAAWAAIHKVRGDSTGSAAMAEVDPTKLPEMGKPELVLLLDHPKVRREAAVELIRRSDPELVEAIYKAVRKMPRAEVVRIVPRLVDFGEAAGDALIDGLEARKTFVRQASALALGHLGLRRAVVPLVHLLQNEPSEIWREIARVLGEFGNAAFRSLSRALKDPKGHEERLQLTLAHLANNGCDKQVDKLTKDADRAAAVLALEALSLRQRAKQEAAGIRGERALDTSDPVLLFSRRFYEELAGTAPEADLAEVDV